MMRTILAGVTLAVVVGCGAHHSKFDDDAENEAPGPIAGTGDGKGKADEPKRSPITPAKLQPVIADLGAEGVTPSAIVISFATPIIERDESGRVTSKTVLDIKPKVSGTLTYLGTSQLKFVPAAGFEANTKYTVDLKKVETRDGELEPPGNTTWSHSFTTPPFKLNGWAPTAIQSGGRWVTMELTFSGPVLPNIARANMRFTIDGAEVSNVQANPRGSLNPNIILVTLTDPRMKAGGTLAMTMKEGLMSATGAKAAGGGIL